jgi:putative ABC transport system permease protein
MFTTLPLMVLTSLLKNRLRTALTVLGISIGIAAVICTAALGEASTDRINAQIDALGEDFVWIRAGSETVGGARSGSGGARTMTRGDAIAIAHEVPEIEACSGQVTGREQVIASGRNWNTRYQGVSDAFFEIRRRDLLGGTFFTPADVEAGTRVLVLGQSVSERIFGEEDPVGRTVRMGRFPYDVIGVLASKGTTRGGVDRDDVVFVPISTAQRRIDRRDWITDIMCSVAAPELMDRAEAGIVSLLRARHELLPGDPADFRIQRPLETLQLRASTARTMALMLTAIGGVSLLVGGVGIMNIMLVSVTERRREIGLRLAIGARVRDVRWQFLSEAMSIGLLGGAAGVALGWLGAEILARVFGWPTLVSVDTVLLAVTLAILAGVSFGYYPAHRASALDPIDALRMES